MASERCPADHPAAPLEDQGKVPARPRREPRHGDICPQCQGGRLSYDGLLNLSCPQCGYSISGGFT